ncbi:MAG TPA: pyridoxamine 5'-phosphate oxidase family protein [Glaciihabitans sp.]|jgi:hypothetical protein|nr:pyridoxamine 5'-phosphate oxidase family protein [Glaciihabitans sp.]
MVKSDDVDADGIDDLDASECWRLLADGELGRVGVIRDGEVDIYPVNYLVKDRSIYFRSGPGSKMVDMARHPLVAFEVDGIDERKRWSVVVRGTATRVGFDREIEDSGVRELQSYSPTNKWNYVRIDANVISGRRFRRAQGRRRATPAE